MAFDYLKSASKEEVQGILKECKNLRAEKDGSKGWGKEKLTQHVARIPLSVYLEHEKEFNDDVFLRKFLRQHPEFMVNK